jgi:hypothetical protein
VNLASAGSSLYAIFTPFTSQILRRQILRREEASLADRVEIAADGIVAVAGRGREVARRFVEGEAARQPERSSERLA